MSSEQNLMVQQKDIQPMIFASNDLKFHYGFKLDVKVVLEFKMKIKWTKIYPLNLRKRVLITTIPFELL